MTTLTSTLPRRLSLPMLLSLALHGSVIAGLLYASFHQVVEMPNASQPIMLSMVAPEVQPEPVTQPQVDPQPQPEVEPAPVPEPEPPKAEPVPIPKPEPKPKPKPKPVKQEKVKPKPKQERAPRETKNPFDDATSTQTKPTAAPKPSQAPVTSKPVASGPRAQRIGLPSYPARAHALRIEGRVRVQYDVNSEGRVENIRILSAEPRNMFEREVKQAMKKWRYEAGKPGQNITMNILFRIDGGASIE